MNDLELIVSDLQRRVANMVRRGKVQSVDFSQTPPRVRVECAGGAVTGWLPFIHSRQSVGAKSVWDPLAVGEGVMIISESGDLSLGVVIPSVGNATNAPPSTSVNEHVTKYADGTIIKYDRSAHKLSVDVVGPVSLTASGAVDLSCESATIEASGDVSVTSQSVKLNSDTALSGVVTGECICALTGKPHLDKSSIIFAAKD